MWARRLYWHVVPVLSSICIRVCVCLNICSKEAHLLLSKSAGGHGSTHQSVANEAIDVWRGYAAWLIARTCFAIPSSLFHQWVQAGSGPFRQVMIVKKIFVADPSLYLCCYVTGPDDWRRSHGTFHPSTNSCPKTVWGLRWCNSKGEPRSKLFGEVASIDPKQFFKHRARLQRNLWSQNQGNWPAGRAI